MELDRHNFLVGCIAAVIAVAIVATLIAWASVQGTRSITERHVAGAAACAQAEPSQVVACLVLVKR
jgi:hypothetical protein